MSEQTKIQWCDSTINWWSGCTKVSPGCANCYAEARDNRHMIEPVSHWGKGAPRLKHVGAVKQALAMNRKPWICENCGGASDRHYDHSCTGKPEDACHTDNVKWHRRRIFSLSLGDWLDDEVPIEWLAEMLDTIRQCDQVIWILCTKRPENFIVRLLTARDNLSLEPEPSTYNLSLRGWITRWITNIEAPKNVWFLTSVENQAMADKRIPELLKIPAVVRGLSLEPLLEPVRFDVFDLEELDWLICGCESGPKRRGCHTGWIENILDQGHAAGVPRFVKQVPVNGKVSHDISEWRPALQVQEWPSVK